MILVEFSRLTFFVLIFKYEFVKVRLEVGLVRVFYSALPQAGSLVLRVLPLGVATRCVAGPLPRCRLFGRRARVAPSWRGS